jgi:hypothetical protein
VKKTGLLLALLLTAFSVWAQGTELSIASYTIDDQDIANEFDSAIVKWENQRVSRSETVYGLEIKLHKTSTNSVETIILTEGVYAGGYTIYFNTVVFQRNPEMRFRCEYYGDSDVRLIALYDTNSESRDPYAVLELRTGG